MDDPLHYRDNLRIMLHHIRGEQRIITEAGNGYSSRTATAAGARIELADALTRYAQWPAPTVIISDGAYGVSGFPGDPPTIAELANWYAPHVAAWSRYSLPETTLWFWGTELGWATVHPVLALHG